MLTVTPTSKLSISAEQEMFKMRKRLDGLDQFVKINLNIISENVKKLTKVVGTLSEKKKKERITKKRDIQETFDSCSDDQSPSQKRKRLNGDFKSLEKQLEEQKSGHQPRLVSFVFKLLHYCRNYFYYSGVFLLAAFVVG